jgi:hypothetical protein
MALHFGFMFEGDQRRVRAIAPPLPYQRSLDAQIFPRMVRALVWSGLAFSQAIQLVLICTLMFLNAVMARPL